MHFFRPFLIINEVYHDGMVNKFANKIMINDKFVRFEICVNKTA